MSRHYTAYQYEAAYRPQALRNWEVPKFHCNRPISRHGRTSIIANSRGHLLPGVFRPSSSPWGSYLGTWEMPKYIDKHTAHILNGTIEGKEKVRKCKLRLSQLYQPKKEASVAKTPQQEPEPHAPVAEKKPSASKIAEQFDSKVQVFEKVGSKADVVEKVDSKEQIAEKSVEDVEVPQEPPVKSKKALCPIHDLYDAGIKG
ncbi:unnamed protein product [Acanthoscelides obtectus]|uniref:Cilia- and flagella-associated protein 126 n=1 Tax=Acanthoscelides obtectus TaxID=200917 RepID=A0A9P0NQT7_ACAOB|nr:unnamed protein product [Acanthoscelides obtectus]CAK1672996.1 Protein Flattop homolog [Acanthoscelides obtectus]